MRVPNVRVFDLDVLMLVIPESEYSRGVPITIGTIHIDEIIDLITDEELKAANRQWQRGIISRKVVVKQLQVKENKNVLDQVKGDVKLTRKIVIPPLETISVSGMTNINKHSKHVNIITEPREDGDLFTVPCYSYMRPGSKRATVTLRNLSEKPQTLLKGAVIAQVQPANIIPPKLAPRVTNVNNNNDKDSQDPSPQKIENLFSKLDLSGAEEWEETDRLKLKELFVKFHHIFALEDMELGKTDMVKHVIRLDDQTPFRERYRRIPPHQYDKVKKHLKGNAQCEKFNQTLLGMLGTLETTDKARWQQWVPTLTHAYNCTRCESTGFSPYYLMFGRMPRLPIDIEYGVTQLELIDRSRQNYARKLRARLQWAFQVAKNTNDKESKRQKQYYDRKMRCQKLAIGDVILVKETSSSGNYKINDKWELNPYTVLEHMKDKWNRPIPVYRLKEIVKKGASREKILHRNMLYPFRSVQEAQNPLLVKCNILMDLHFNNC